MASREIQMVEGPEALSRFTEAMQKIFAAPRESTKKKLEQYREEALRNPNRRGPKPKAKP